MMSDAEPEYEVGGLSIRETIEVINCASESIIEARTELESGGKKGRKAKLVWVRAIWVLTRSFWRLF